MSIKEIKRNLRKLTLFRPVVGRKTLKTLTSQLFLYGSCIFPSLTLGTLNGIKSAFVSGPEDSKRGLTKREYFAVMALQGLLAGSIRQNTLDDLTALSVKLANLLLRDLD